jgi:SNF2 family DNA or RNA helicase
MEKLENESCRTFRTPESNRSLYKSESFYESNINILADPVGSGKTLTTISFLSRNIDAKTPVFSYSSLDFFTDGERRSNTLFYVKSTVPCLLVNVNVVIIYGAIYNQWVQEINHSSLKNRYKLIYKKIHLEHIDNWIKNVDVIIVTYEQFNEFLSAFRLSVRNLSNISYEDTICVKRLIFDEYVIEKRIKSLSAKHYWILSGSIPITAGVVQRPDHRNYGYVGEISQGIVPLYCAVKNTDEDIRNSYNQATVITKVYKCSNKTLKLLNDYIPDKVKRMIAANDISSAISYLGGDVGVSKLSDMIVAKENYKIKQLYADIEYYTHLKNEERVEQIKHSINISEKKLEILKERIAESEKNDCPVCFDEMNKLVATGCCKNVFCENCLSTILNSTSKCPFCREKIDVKSLIMSDPTIEQNDEKKSHIDEENTESYSSKEDAVKSIISSKKDGRFASMDFYILLFKSI